MIAIDTNVLVRAVVQDDPAQAEAAREVLGSGPLWVAKTVLLETEWVLRYSYRLERERILAIFRRLLGFPPLEVEDRRAVLKALEWFAEGFDFADALHLASGAGVERFATFDGDFAKVAARCRSKPQVILLESAATDSREIPTG